MLCNVSPTCLLQRCYALEKPTTNPRPKNGEKKLCTRGPTMLCTTVEKKMKNTMHQRTNTATHQKKYPRYPENTMVKTQGPTLLRTRKNALVFQKTRWRKPKDQHCYDLEKRLRYPARKHDGENPRTNTATI